MCTYYNALGDKVTTTACYYLDNLNVKYHWLRVNLKFKR